MDPITRFPLCWPAARPRTPAHKRERSDFCRIRTEYVGTAGQGGHARKTRERVSFAAARDELLAELGRLGAKDLVLSTNVELRRDGLPYADRRQPADPGVAVYFRHKGREVVFACDRWDRVEDNLRAVAKTIEALRGIDRWGTGDMVEAAFTGFAALPPAGGIAPPRKWWVVLGVEAHAPTADVLAAYRRLVLECHPDRNGGDDARMKEVNGAYEQFKKERGL